MYSSVLIRMKFKANIIQKYNLDNECVSAAFYVSVVSNAYELCWAFLITKIRAFHPHLGPDPSGISVTKIRDLQKPIGRQKEWKTRPDVTDLLGFAACI